jgi:hypothetical protein
MKKTAVEWLEDNFGYIQSGNMSLKFYFEQAKEMEKEQIKECWKKAQDEQRKEFSSNYCSIKFEDYYNETFKTN